MEEKIGLVALSDNDLKQCNGGFSVMLVIRLFIPTIKGILGFEEGVKEGYTRATATP